MLVEFCWQLLVKDSGRQVSMMFVGPEEVNQILNGKEYNYVIIICKVIFEALQRAKLDVFEGWLQKEKNSNILTNFLESEVFAELIKKREPSMFNTCLESISALLDIYYEFEIKIRNGGFGLMAMFRQSYVKSIRLTDWKLHFQSTERMLVRIHAYGGSNCARHFSYYWCSHQKTQNKFAASIASESASIITVGSDLAILSMYYQHRLDLKLFLHIGTGFKEKIFNIKTKDLSTDVVNALAAVHALSGCDSTFSFSGIGQEKFFKSVCKEENYYNVASILGESGTINDTGLIY